VGDEVDQGTGLDDEGPEERLGGGPAVKRVTVSYTNYLGGHPIHPKKHTGGVLRFEADGVHMRAFRDLFVIPWTDVEGLFVEGSEEIQRRVTAGRLLTLGAFAFAAKKKIPNSAYVTVTTKDGDAIFVCTKTGPHAIKAKLTSAIRWVEEHKPSARPNAEPSLPATASIADELAKFAKLRDDGILSAEEFDAQKAKLLGQQ
jgi:hypothetical protein